jgi:hypothetical protein
MKAGAELAAWIADPQAQRASRLRADTLAARWSEHPLIDDLRKELASVPIRSAERVLAAAERFMDREAEIGSLFQDLVRAAQADPFFTPPLGMITTEINSGYLLYADPDVSIALGHISADALAAKKVRASGPASIVFTGLLTSYRFLKSGSAMLSLWEAPRIGPDFSGEASGRCRLIGRRRLSDGEQLILDGRFQSFVIEHATGDMVCLHAGVHAGCAPLTVGYDSATHRFSSATSTDEASSRIQMMVSLLRVMDRTDAVPVIERLLDSPHFYTRWHLMRELLALDAQAALPSLRRMAASDPHPEVRAAAGQTLRLFFEDEPEEVLACRA